MSAFASLGLFTAAWLVLLVSPGPDFAATIQRAASRSRREGVMVALGITAGLAVWSTGSLLGLAVLLTTAAWLYDLLRLAGAAYLIYLGLRAIIRAACSADSVPAACADRRSAFWVGFLTDMSNPKAVVFFGSLFTSLLPADRPAWYCLVACLFSTRPVVGAYRLAKRWLDYATAAIFMALGGRLATAS
jgi:threonine/homoserine/homoserine lactone efflux protein